MIPNAQHFCPNGLNYEELTNYDGFVQYRCYHALSVYEMSLTCIHNISLQFSSWLKSMECNYQRVRVRTLLRQEGKEHVQVLEEDRPKPSINSRYVQGLWPVSY